MRTQRFDVWVTLACALAGCSVPFADGPQQYGGAIASRDLRRGEHVFMYTCAACHEGRVNPNGYRWEPWRMRRQVREGNHLMPPLPRSLVSESDLEAVLAYLTTIGAVDGELPPPDRPAAPEPVDPSDESAWGLTAPRPPDP